MALFSTLRILDLSRVFSGPFATRHFAEFGAEVIKIEPLQGDDSRSFPPLVGNWSGYFEILNHNKQSISLNLKEESDLQKFYDLCKQADVIVENFSPAVKKRLKIDYETILTINDRIIYASLSGVSESIDKKYYDVIAQAESGLISLNGEDNDMKVSTAIVDAFAGMKLAYAISSALYARSQTHQGTHLTVSMKGSAFDLLEQNLIASSITHINPAKIGNLDSAIAPFGIFPTSDGNIALAVGNDALWQKLETFLQEKCNPYPDLNFSSNESRLQNLPALQEWIGQVFSAYTAHDLSAILLEKGIPSGEVKRMLDVLADQENYETNLLQSVDLEVGRVVVPTGGITFSNYQQVPYLPAPARQP